MGAIYAAGDVWVASLTFAGGGFAFGLIEGTSRAMLVGPVVAVATTAILYFADMDAEGPFNLSPIVVLLVALTFGLISVPTGFLGAVIGRHLRHRKEAA